MRTSEKVLIISVLKVGICCEMLDGSATRSVMSCSWGRKPSEIGLFST